MVVDSISKFKPFYFNLPSVTQKQIRQCKTPYLSCKGVWQYQFPLSFAPLTLIGYGNERKRKRAFNKSRAAIFKLNLSSEWACLRFPHASRQAQRSTHKHTQTRMKQIRITMHQSTSSLPELKIGVVQQTCVYWHSLWYLKKLPQLSRYPSRFESWWGACLSSMLFLQRLASQLLCLLSVYRTLNLGGGTSKCVVNVKQVKQRQWDSDTVVTS